MMGGRFELDVIDLARAAAEGVQVMPEALALLDRHIGATVLSVSMMSLGSDIGAEVALRGGAPITATEDAEWRRLIGTHPFFGHLVTGPPRTARLTDVVDLEEFEHSEVYQRLLHPRASRYQVGLPLERSAQRMVLLSLWRDHADFTDDEVVALEQFRAAFAAALAFRAAIESLQARAQTTDAAPSRLTPRQRQVAALVELGLTNGQIGARLGLTERTVRKHVGDLFAALRCDTRTLIAVRWRAGDDGDRGGGEPERMPPTTAESSLI
jgi:DNA-binding CsgD family transcriptional regulator